MWGGVVGGGRTYDLTSLFGKRVKRRFGGRGRRVELLGRRAYGTHVIKKRYPSI